MQSEHDNLVLLYRPVGEAMPNFPNIGNDEFLLGIMNESQQELLKLHNHCVMINSTNGMNQYGFQLTTAMVHDENHEGLPVAVLFSTKTAAETFMPFFSAIKERVPDMRTNVLMSDDTTVFYNSWKL